MPVLPPAPVPLHNQPTLQIIGNPSGDISGNMAGNVVHLLILRSVRSLPPINLATLHLIGNNPGNNPGNISGNKIGNNSGNTARIITTARAVSATAPMPEKFTTRANHTSSAATPAPRAKIPATKSATFSAISVSANWHLIRPTAFHACALHGAHRCDFNRPPHSGNVFGKHSGKASATYPPTTLAPCHHHRPPRTSQRREILHSRWQHLRLSAIARRGLGINVPLMYTCAGLASAHHVT